MNFDLPACLERPQWLIQTAYAILNTMGFVVLPALCIHIARDLWKERTR